MGAFPLKHVYEAQQFDRRLLDTVFETADDMKRDMAEGGRRYGRSLANKIMASLFYEPSTRTRFSFEAAMMRLGGNLITTENAREFSSAAKGESLYDSTRIMNGYADIIVMRHHEAGSAEKAARVSTIPVINAGDGAGQHPTQALLDLYTIKDHFSEINNLKVAMVGDLKYGRTVRSLSYLLTKYSGIRIVFVSPPVCRMASDIKSYLDKEGIPWAEDTDLDNVLPQVDCVYMTRIQKERFIIPEDYDDAVGKYVLTPEKVRRMKPDAIIMHPLPRLDEIPRAVDDDPRAHYFEQAQNGLYIRMALLYLLLTAD
ncbi:MULTISPECIES: aspartate carbamoyltransferase [Desulfococcus]|jgi:aspartate carbamoyltransferase catalytic subunit|uniref:Aspartate carbamoyltransferase n=1 Tax=Desulfococcus multivorans DSM 2059 TaxID=1121405 RepID=S7UY81_DESML|nr:aspartate carbamoyltransferase [Desulfococcus multivorans]AOY60278.1 PyrB: aspartate carbamoyltransferase [Desulfococcus multivorans]AQV02389.1 aspartate carbamoyltransferase [Desulfococcus multivorans]EPR39204.1 Aspartate carbamoyltransferase [Desulfococcus multivorans DSM 2059]SJZ57750.1 aspartate carbamoyltransferase [Desulfococcus multivorans DSM 2059]